MGRSLPMSPDYRVAVFNALALQTLVAVISLLVLERGFTARLCGVALLGFWVTVAVVIARRPRKSTHADLGFIRFGYVPLALPAFLAS
jgi:hypothetical protein